MATLSGLASAIVSRMTTHFARSTPPPPSSSASAESATAFTVLTDASLFEYITAFQSGLPGGIIAFDRQYDVASAQRWQLRGRLPILAIMVEDYAILMRLYRLYVAYRHGPVSDDLDFANVMYETAIQNRLEALQWLHTHTDLTCPPHTVRHAATFGNRPVIEWLRAYRPDAWGDITVEPCDALAFSGNLELVQYMHTSFPGLVLSTDAMDYAAAQGHLALVEFLHRHRTEGCTTDAMDSAARNGHVEIVRFLHTNRTEGCTIHAMDGAAENGHLEIVRFLHEHRTEGCSEDAMDGAAKHGHLDIVTFLHNHRTEGCTTYAMDMAAWHNHVDVLAFLHHHRREGFTPMAMGGAAQYGWLNVVQFLHEHQENESNCHEDALSEAARFNHLDIVDYLVKNCTKGCLHTARKCADERDHDQVVMYLTKHMRDDIKTCSIRQHQLRDKTRRCQREVARFA